MLFPYVFVFVCVLYLCVFCICISGIFIAGLLWRVGRAQAGGSSPLIRRESWARLKACLPTQGPTRACTKLVPPTPVSTPKYAHSGAHWGMHQHLWPLKKYAHSGASKYANTSVACACPLSTPKYAHTIIKGSVYLQATTAQFISGVHMSLRVNHSTVQVACQPQYNSIGEHFSGAPIPVLILW